MMFEFTNLERGRLEELLYWLRRCGYAVDLHYSREDAVVTANRQVTGGASAVQVAFRRYGQKLQVAATIHTPEGGDLHMTRVEPVITYVRASLR